MAALNDAPATDDEAVCADQMRAILAAEHLPYSTLATDPGLLLAASEHMFNAAPGALWTRFTVTYNLYVASKQ